MIHRASAVIAAGALCALVACGGNGAGDGTSMSPTPTQTEGAAGEPIDLVLLADSGGWGIAEEYAALAAEALDREVEVHDHSLGGAGPLVILDEVQGAGANDVAGAEIVVFYVHPGVFTLPAFEICLEAWDAVAGGAEWSPGMTWEPVPEKATVEDYQGYRDALDQVYDAIWALREGQPTILRAYGAWNPWVAPWRQVGIEAECNSHQEAADEARRQAAEAAGAVYVSMMDVFNGPQHDKDPIEKGLISEDGMHLNDAGHVVLAEALAAVGFEVSEQPR